jgi:hypothetical protein
MRVEVNSTGIQEYPMRYLTFALCLTLAHLAAAAEPQASHAEIESIGKTAETKFKDLQAFALNGDGNLMACDAKLKAVRIISPAGKLLKEWKLDFGPTRIRCVADGTVYVGGRSALAKFDKDGKELKRIQPALGRRVINRVSGIAVTDKHVFASFGSPGTLGSKAIVVRYDRDLGNAKQIARGLRGCCRRLDMIAKDGALFIAENARFRILKYDAEGKELAKWGARSRSSVEGFGSCCNPMNITFGPNGELYTAESGLGRIKRYTVEGKFLGLIGEVGTRRFSRAGGLAASCSNITVAVSKDGSLVFVQDVTSDTIRVLKRKDTKK